MDINALRDAVLQGAQTGNPSAPIASFPELTALNASSNQLPLSNALTQSSVAGAQEQIDAQKIAEANAKRAQAEAEKRAKDLADPNKYRVVKKKDGGFDFFDPNGDQVDIATLSQRTGTKPKDWLADSENPIDIQYRNDQKNLDKFVNAIAQKDKKTTDEFINSDSTLKQYVSGRGGIQKLIDQFKNTYQRYYVTRQENPRAWGVSPNRVVVPATGGGGAIGTPNQTGYGGPGGGGVH